MTKSSTAPPQKRRSVTRVESAETQDCVSEPQWIEEENEEEMKELSFIPSAVSEPRCALHMCDYKCRKEGFKFYQLPATVTEGGKAHTINLFKQCYKVRRMKQGERRVTASKWREMVEQKTFRGRLWAACGMERGPGNMEQTAIGNRRRRTKKRLNLSGTAVACALKVHGCGACEAEKVRRLEEFSGRVLER